MAKTRNSVIQRQEAAGWAVVRCSVEEYVDAHEALTLTRLKDPHYQQMLGMALKARPQAVEACWNLIRLLDRQDDTAERRLRALVVLLDDQRGEYESVRATWKDTLLILDAFFRRHPELDPTGRPAMILRMYEAGAAALKQASSESGEEPTDAAVYDYLRRANEECAAIGRELPYQDLPGNFETFRKNLSRARTPAGKSKNTRRTKDRTGRSVVNFSDL